MSAPRSVLRQRILTFVFSLVVISLAGSILTLSRMTEVNRVLDAINRVSVPLGRMMAQMQSDSEIFRRELDRSLGFAHWTDPHWKPRASPRWIEDVITHEHARVSELVAIESEWAAPEARKRWQEWSQNTARIFESLKEESVRLQQALERTEPGASRETAVNQQIHAQWNARLEEWIRVLQWGAAEYEHSLRQTFNTAESRVSELRTGLEVILGAVILLSLLLLWLGERALRPLGELTRLAREITRRGLRREDKAILPDLILSRGDEVSQLAREFHGMATALLEREKTVELQKHRVEEQNKLLREIGALNENILQSIESILIVADLSGRITQCNPVAARWLGAAVGDDGAEHDRVIGTELLAWSKVQAFLPEFPRAGELAPTRLEPKSVGDRVYGGHLVPLKHEGAPSGAILVLEDLTEEKGLEHRLRMAENLAAVGRMSAQVAHEIRNPLHSLGLEAEMALEQALAMGSPALKQSLYSILGAVDRLEKITENYLKLSRLSAGKKAAVDLGGVLECVLATYASTCEAQGVRMDWQRESGAALGIWGDGDLLEQVFGNLLRNALQALEIGGSPEPTIRWTLGSLESGKVWIRIQDNGPGLADEVRARLFTPFVTTRAQGTGLGLSFIKQVVEDHGGTIDWIDAGPGTCFEIRLPGQASKAAAAMPDRKLPDFNSVSQAPHGAVAIQDHKEVAYAQNPPG